MCYDKAVLFVCAINRGAFTCRACVLLGAWELGRLRLRTAAGFSLFNEDNLFHEHDLDK